MINSVCGIRSTGRICTDLAESLAKQGHECKIAYGRETVPEKYQEYAIRIGNSLSVKKDVLLSRVLDNAGFNSRKETLKFIKWIRDYDPDIIHLHNLHGYYINVEVLFEYLKECQKPVVWTLHDCWAFTGHCAYFDLVGCDKWQCGCRRCPQSKEYPKSFFLDRSRNNYLRKKALFDAVSNLTIVTPSKWLADLTSKSFLTEKMIKIVHNGIDTDVFQQTVGNFRERYGLIGKKIILGVASVWGKRKGLEDFIKLSEILDPKYQIVLVGVTEKQREKLPRGILGITRTNSAKELAEIYSAADIFVNPTYQDNYPTVNLEAQACGTPVITYRTGGSIESVPMNSVVEQGNIEALKEKITSFDVVCNDSSTFDKRVMLEQYFDIYISEITSFYNLG